jgi:hypothetical protein
MEDTTAQLLTVAFNRSPFYFAPDHLSAFKAGSEKGGRHLAYQADGEPGGNVGRGRGSKPAAL